MKRSVTLELHMNRELVMHFMTGGTVETKNGVGVCWFCKEPLLTEVSTTFGHHKHHRIRVLKENGDRDGVTVHHKNGNHFDNSPSNRALGHRACHKAHHMAERAAELQAAKAKKNGKR